MVFIFGHVDFDRKLPLGSKYWFLILYWIYIFFNRVPKLLLIVIWYLRKCMKLSEMRWWEMDIRVDDDNLLRWRDIKFGEGCQKKNKNKTDTSNF